MSDPYKDWAQNTAGMTPSAPAGTSPANTDYANWFVRANNPSKDISDTVAQHIVRLLRSK